MKLEDLIKSSTLSLRKLAAEIGVTRPTLYSVLNGKGVSLPTVKKICAYFGVDYKDYI